MLYENAAFAVMTTASGQSFIQSSMSASGTKARHASGLDAKMSAEASRAALGLSREEANQIVLDLYDLYGAEIEHRHVGKPFEEVYDLETVRPTPEWDDLYQQVEQDLNGLGLRMS